MKTRITYVAVFGFVDSAENHVADLVCHFAVAADPVCRSVVAVDLVYHFVAVAAVFGLVGYLNYSFYTSVYYRYLMKFKICLKQMSLLLA